MSSSTSMTSGAAAAASLRDRLERKNIRKLVEELRAVSFHQHDADIGDAMLNVLEWVRVSSDESEENKAVRSALEALYSCSVEGSLSLPVLEKACVEYLLPPAKINPDKSTHGNSAQRMCCLQLGCFLSGSLISARLKQALTSSSSSSSLPSTMTAMPGRPPLHTVASGPRSASTAHASAVSNAFALQQQQQMQMQQQQQTQQRSTDIFAAQPKQSPSAPPPLAVTFALVGSILSSGSQFEAVVVNALSPALAALTADPLTEGKLPSKLRKERALARMTVAPVMTALAFLMRSYGGNGSFLPAIRAAVAASLGQELPRDVRRAAASSLYYLAVWTLKRSPPASRLPPYSLNEALERARIAAELALGSAPGAWVSTTTTTTFSTTIKDTGSSNGSSSSASGTSNEAVGVGGVRRRPLKTIAPAPAGMESPDGLLRATLLATTISLGRLSAAASSPGAVTTNGGRGSVAGDAAGDERLRGRCYDAILNCALNEHTRPAVQLGGIRDLCSLGFPALLQHYLSCRLEGIPSIPTTPQEVAAAQAQAQAKPYAQTPLLFPSEIIRARIMATHAAIDDTSKAIRQMCACVAKWLREGQAAVNCPLLSAAIRTASAIGGAVGKLEKAAAQALLQSPKKTMSTTTRKIRRWARSIAAAPEAAAASGSSMALALHLQSMGLGSGRRLFSSSASGSTVAFDSFTALAMLASRAGASVIGIGGSYGNNGGLFEPLLKLQFWADAGMCPPSCTPIASLTVPALLLCAPSSCFVSCSPSVFARVVGTSTSTSSAVVTAAVAESMRRINICLSRVMLHERCSPAYDPLAAPMTPLLTQARATYLRQAIRQRRASMPFYVQAAFDGVISPAPLRIRTLAGSLSAASLPALSFNISRGGHELSVPYACSSLGFPAHSSTPGYGSVPVVSTTPAYASPATGFTNLVSLPASSPSTNVLPSADRAQAGSLLKSLAAGAGLDPGSAPHARPAVSLSTVAISAAKGQPSFSLTRTLAGTSSSSSTQQGLVRFFVGSSMGKRAPYDFEVPPIRGPASASPAAPAMMMSRQALFHALQQYFALDGAVLGATGGGFISTTAAIKAWATLMNEHHVRSLQAFNATEGYSKGKPKHGVMGPWGPHYVRSAGASAMPDRAMFFASTRYIESAAVPSLPSGQLSLASPGSLGYIGATNDVPVTPATLMLALREQTREPGSGETRRRITPKAPRVYLLPSPSRRLPIDFPSFLFYFESNAPASVPPSSSSLPSSPASLTAGAAASATSSSDAAGLLMMKMMGVKLQVSGDKTRPSAKGGGAAIRRAESAFGTKLASVASPALQDGYNISIADQEDEEPFYYDSAEAADERVWVRLLRACIVAQSAVNLFAAWG